MTWDGRKIHALDHDVLTHNSDQDLDVAHRQLDTRSMSPHKVLDPEGSLRNTSVAMLQIQHGFVMALKTSYRRVGDVNSIIIILHNLHLHAAKTNITILRQRHLVPVARSKLDRLALSHAIHDPLDGPRLELVAWREVGWNVRFVESLAFVHRGNVLLVVLVGICLRVVLPHPLRVLGLRAARVKLDLRPVGVLQQLGVREANLLRACIPREAKEKVSVVMRAK